MSYGPIELVQFRFPGNKFSGEILPALAELVDTEIVRVIDILFILKDADGAVAIVELTELEPDVYELFEVVVDDVAGLLNEDDARLFSGLLEPNSSAALMLFENVWATKFMDAVRKANGEVVYAERIPRAAIEQLVAEAAAAGLS